MAKKSGLFFAACLFMKNRRWLDFCPLTVDFAVERSLKLTQLSQAYLLRLLESWFCQNLSQKICFTAAKHSGANNGRFRALKRRRQMKNRAAKDEDLHTGPTFVHVFCSIFATFRVSVSTPNFQKSTPNFQKALTFENRGTPFFEKQAQATDF